jgi:hypothetical protein
MIEEGFVLLIEGGCRALVPLDQLSNEAYRDHHALAVWIGSEPTRPRALEKVQQQVQGSAHPGTPALHPVAAHLMFMKSTAQRRALLWTY